jgi:hypothetical protein
VATPGPARPAEQRRVPSMSLRRLLSSEIASIVRSGRTLRPRFEEIPPAAGIWSSSGTDYSVPGGSASEHAGTRNLRPGKTTAAAQQVLGTETAAVAGTGGFAAALGALRLGRLPGWERVSGAFCSTANHLAVQLLIT